MSDSQRLKDSVSEFNKAKKKIEDIVNKVQENSRQVRREREEQSSLNR